VGDVRSLAHLELFHRAVGHPDGREAEDSELVVDPRFFELLARRLVDVEGIRVELKSGRAKNEMNLFRYDVVIRKKGGPGRLHAPLVAAVAAPTPCSVEALEELLAQHPAGLRVKGIPNARLASQDVPGALHPDDVRAIDASYDVEVRFSPDRVDLMDVTFRPRGAAPMLERPESIEGRLEEFTNEPSARRATAKAQTAILRAYLKTKLPEYMLPACIVALDALPRTANGKIDRARLPAPAVVDTRRTPPSRVTDGQSSEEAVDRVIASVFEELLGTSEIDQDDNFFDLGANSLMMVQASVRIREALGRSVSLVQLFQFPTVRGLAAALAQAGDPQQGAAAGRGQERAQARQDAMNRRRELRRTRWQ
jgi:acyl carrier protein